MEANAERREEYNKAIKDIPKEDLVYLDESGMEKNMIKEKSSSLKCTAIPAKKSGTYYERTNIIAGLVNNKPISPFVFNGPCNTELFNKWVETFLIKELKPGQVVIMDNAAFHKSPRRQELIESVGCKVIFLPPYSPDLNPIEKFWANMKRWIKDKISQFTHLYDAIQHFFACANST